MSTFNMMLAQESLFVFGLWQWLSVAAVILLIVGYKIWKNKTMG